MAQWKVGNAFETQKASGFLFLGQLTPFFLLEKERKGRSQSFFWRENDGRDFDFLTSEITTSVLMSKIPSRLPRRSMNFSAESKSGTTSFAKMLYSPKTWCSSI